MNESRYSSLEETVVLVTGLSGFIAQHVALGLLQAGYRVRGTVRDLKREPELRALFGGAHSGRLQVVRADLEQDRDWEAAVAGCRYVQHLASPFPDRLPKHEQELVNPAREGTLRVLRAAQAAGVERMVLTSSIAAIMFGHDDDAHVFDEGDWSVAERCSPYQKSKTLAERAAWDFVRSVAATNPLQLVVINPGLVLGPSLGKDCSTSGEMVRKLLARSVPACVGINMPVVDVRDVAAAHITAMTTPQAAGQRFLCASESASMQQIARILQQRYPERRIPTRQLPNWLAWLFSYVDPTLRTVRDEIGKAMRFDNARIRNVLHWQPRSLDEMVLSMAETLIAHGYV